MPKDRSFAHRIHQSNIDRQRNQEFFLSRPAVSAPAPQEPKVGLWEKTKGLLGKAQAFHKKHEGVFLTIDVLLTAWVVCIIARSYFQ